MLFISKGHMRIIIFFFICLFTFADVYAADDTSAPIYLHDYKEAEDIKQAPTEPEPPEDPTKKGKKPLYLHDYKPETSKLPLEPSTSYRITLGSFNPTTNSGRLQGASGGSSAGGEIGFKPKETISYRLELLALNSKYDTPPPLISELGWNSISDSMTLESRGLLFGVKVSYPKDRVYRFHATGGVGFFRSELTVRGTETGAWFSFPARESDTDSNLGFHAGVGVEMGSEDYVVGLEYRHLTLDASFSKFGVRSEDIGGNYTGLSLGWFY